jgi:heptosyltransferase II
MSERDVKRILVIELWNIGDVVLTLPFLSQLRALFPDSTTTLLARPYAREILEGTGLVHEFVDAELAWKPALQGFAPLSYNWRELLRVLVRLRKKKFDLGFQARPHIREYVLLGLSGAARRVGIQRRGWDRLLTDPISVREGSRQKKDDWLRLLAPFGGPVALPESHLRVTDAERRWALEIVRPGGVTSRRLVVGIHPGASFPEKRWPLDRFHHVARVLAAHPDVRVVTFTDPGGYGAELGKIEGTVPAKVELRQMIALIEACDLLVCNDSGPMHIAAALGVPTVAMFGSGIDRSFAPLGEGHELLSPDTLPGHDHRNHDVIDPHDVSGVPTERVLAVVERALGRAAESVEARERARILLSSGQVTTSTR